jgi:hypothetical protein
MRRLTFLLLPFVLALRLAAAADIPSAADVCVGGQTETTPSSDFVALDDGSRVSHTITSLEWQRCALGQTWEAATNRCAGRPKTFSWMQVGRLTPVLTDGWRLPTGTELTTIVEKCHSSPAINPQVFPNTPGALFWSASVDTGGIERIWSLSFFSGRPYRPSTLQAARIRLVRGTLKINPE